MEILKTPNSAGKTRIKFLALLICVLTCTVGFSKNGYAQQGTQMVRLAKIKVDPAQLEQYNTALKEQMSAAIRVEPGVLMLLLIKAIHPISPFWKSMRIQPLIRYILQHLISNNIKKG